MTDHERPLEYRSVGEDRRAVRRSAGRIVTGAVVGSLFLFVAGMCAFGMAVDSTKSLDQQSRTLQFVGVGCAALAAVAWGWTAVNWPRREGRPFLTGAAAGVGTTAAILATWSFVG